MEIKSITNAGNPSFCALKQSAVDVFKKKMQPLDPEGQNQVLEELIQFAKIAQESDVLDLASGKDTIQRGENTLIYEYNNRGTYGGYSVVPMQFDTFSRDENGEIVATAEKSNFACFKFVNGKYQAPLKDFFAAFTQQFSAKEQERNKELDAQQKQSKLSDKLDIFVKK